MKSRQPPTVRLALQAQPQQLQRLRALQARFAEACNALAPLVAQTRCWNRVALHHMAYKGLRERFPDLGSQMACNAIYSVSRISRIVYQHPQSPFNVARMGERVLPQLQFKPHAPVYFDRHTLSLKDGVISMFTLDGRMRFELNLAPAHEQRFREQKLREIVLTGDGTQYSLSFEFGSDDAAPAPAPTQSSSDRTQASTDWPEYVLVTADGADGAENARPLPQWMPAAPTAPTPPSRAARASRVS
jgi:hypothetical protein